MESHISRKTSEIWGTRPSSQNERQIVSGVLTQTLKPDLFVIVYGPTKVVP